MVKTLLLLGMAVVLLGVAAVPPPYGEPMIERWVMASGSSSSLPGEGLLFGTLGQWAVGRASSGDSTLYHGFWAGAASATEYHALYLPVIQRRPTPSGG